MEYKRKWDRSRAREDFKRAWELIQSNDHVNAFSLLKSSLSHYPQFIPAHVLLIELNKESKIDKNDFSLFYGDLLKDEEDPAFLFVKGLLCDSFAEKMKYFEKSLELNDEYFWTLYTLNTISYEQPDKENEIIEKIPHLKTNSNYYYTKGLVCHHHEKPKEAAAFYEEALKMNKRYVDAHFNLSVAYDELGQEELALKHYNKTIGYNPYFVDAQYNLGCFYLNKDDFKQATDYFRKCNELDPYFYKSRNNLAICFIKQNYYDLALEEIKKAIKIKPDSVEAYFNYGFILFERKEFKKAIDVYKKLLKICPNDKRIQLELGLSYIEAGKYDDVKSELIKALKVKPDPIVLENLKNLVKE